MEAVQVSALSDDELFKRLKSYGVDVGPIVGSTRNLYEKKLQKLMNGEESIREVSQEEPEEDSEPDDIEESFIENEQSFVENSYKESPRSTLSQEYSVRYEPLQKPTSYSPPMEEYKNSDSYIRSRPGLSSVSATFKTPSPPTLKSSAATTSKSSAATTSSYKDHSSLQNAESSSSSFGVVIKLAIVSFIMAFLLFIVYTNMESDQHNPVPSV